MKAGGDLTVFTKVIPDGWHGKAWGNASAVTTTSSVVRISKPNLDGRSKSCKGMVRFGLTSDPDDNHEFQHGFYIGLVPSLKAPETGDTYYLASADDPETSITLTINDDCGPAVLQNGILVHTFSNAASCTGSMHAKVFIQEPSDRVHLEALTEPMNEDTTWEQAFTLPEAASELRKRSKRSSCSSAEGINLVRSSNSLELNRRHSSRAA
jgi:hypothetical protein